MEADKRGGHTLRGCKYLLGGAMSGWFTPTEAGMVAAAYILIVVFPALNPRHVRSVWGDFVQAGLIDSLPLVTIAAASAFRLGRNC